MEAERDRGAVGSPFSVTSPPSHVLCVLVSGASSLSLIVFLQRLHLCLLPDWGQASRLMLIQTFVLSPSIFIPLLHLCLLWYWVLPILGSSYFCDANVLIFLLYMFLCFSFLCLATLLSILQKWVDISGLLWPPLSFFVFFWVYTFCFFTYCLKDHR